IFSLQLADAAHEVDSNGLFYDLLHLRKAPLEGDFTLTSMKEMLERIDGLSSIGIELFSDHFDSLGTTEAGIKAANSIDAWLSQEEEHVEKVLLNQVWNLCHATITQNETNYNELLSDRFIGISFNGKRVDKSFFTQVHMNPENIFSTFSTTEVSVAMLGGYAGIVDGIITIGHPNSNDVQKNRFSTTLVKESENWKIFMWQDSPIL
ncbi:MAG: nuclear transport factor 2 family protein, partial [Bacteroidota bacterium]